MRETGTRCVWDRYQYVYWPTHKYEHIVSTFTTTNNTNKLLSLFSKVRVSLVTPDKSEDEIKYWREFPPKKKEDVTSSRNMQCGKS